MPIAILSRAKPQNCDALQIFQSASRVFFGYPLLRQGAEYNRDALCTCLVNPSVTSCREEKEWKSAAAAVDKRKMYTQTRNFIREVERARRDGAIVMIPRPSPNGVVYLARITGPFEVVCAPSWGEEYLRLRVEKGLDRDDNERRHIADVAQGWPVDCYRKVDYPLLPGWLRRNSYSHVGFKVLRATPPFNTDVTAYTVLDRILVEQCVNQRTWTLALDEIKKRLVEDLNPSSLENLVVSILQKEHREEVWQHTGGPGDGGIDGIGSNEAGKTVGLLQVKLFADPAPAFPDRPTDDVIRRYVAVLLPENPTPPADGSKLLDLDWIACAVKRHWRGLPQALSMRVGEGP